MPASWAATTSSQASPEGRTRCRSNTNARRSWLPWEPAVTSVTRNAQFSPKYLQHRQQCLGAAADLLDRDDVEAADDLGDAQQVAEVADGGVASCRSEERRVGKECRSRWS